MKIIAAFSMMFFLFFSTLAEQQKEITLYQKYMNSYEHADNESNFFQLWITLPFNKKLLNRVAPSEEAIKDLIAEEAESSEFVGVIKNKKFQIQAYKSSDDAKYIVYKADVVTCYKDACPKEISYRVSMEVNDSFYPDGSREKVVLLKKIKNVYVSDPFLSFSATENIKLLFKRSLPAATILEKNKHPS